MHSAYIDQIFSSKNKSIFNVYRGQRLASKDFEKLKQNINGFVSMNTFLSTTTQSNVALMYSGNGESRPLFESVLFEIEIEKSYSTEPFADICPVSFFQNENEILFTIGSIFQINSLYELTQAIWLIQLSLVTYTDEDTGRLAQFLRESINSKPTLKDLNDIFLQMNDCQRVVRYSKTLLKQTSLTDVDRADIYLTLGDAELHINRDYTKAEKWFLDVQQIALASSPSNYYFLALFHESMALLQIEKNNYTTALELLDEVLQIALDHSFQSKIIIRTYSNLGLVYRKILNFDRACENYEKALSIITQSNTLPKLHPFHSVIHNNLAYTKQLQNNYDEALKHYNLALEIERKSLPSTHSITATTLSNIMLNRKFTVTCKKDLIG
ncbi:unnamed protein product [Rotaria sp. Silwood2]|nr:unnamed protein product [Rotaria sp. Silwood2]CAF4568350.1 unnamed protein product [Rotaria sp. Silwood2]